MNYVLCFNTRFNNILDCKIKTFYENRDRKIEKRKTDRGHYKPLYTDKNFATIFRVLCIFNLCVFEPSRHM